MIIVYGNMVARQRQLCFEVVKKWYHIVQKTPCGFELEIILLRSLLKLQVICY